MKNNLTNIGDTLAAFRKKAGLTQIDVANELTKAGYPIQNKSIYAWEKNKSTPNPTQFLLLCKMYGITDIYTEFIGPNPDDPFVLLNDEGKEKAQDFIRILGLTDEYSVKNSLKYVLDKANNSDAETSSDYAAKQRELPLFLLAASAGPGEFVDSDAHEMVVVGSEVPESASFGIRLNGNSMEPRYMNGQIVWVYRTAELYDGDIGIFYLDGQAYCKKLHKNNGTLELLSFNPDYDPIQITEDSEFKIFGRVVS
ncbi:MAG: XRE family transcriptional regulator [Eubacterium sp.]|nr:XRE family transcriptional regulator [Eubacterium sp.]